LVHFDVTVAVHLALAFVKEREPPRWQGPQGRPFHLRKQLADLLADRAVDTLVGDRVLPVEQMAVLFFESVEDLTLEGIALDVADTRLDFPLVPRRARPRRQDRHTVIL